MVREIVPAGWRLIVCPKLPQIGRFVRADEVTAALVFLLSTEAGAITGQQLVVCCGGSLRPRRSRGLPDRARHALLIMSDSGRRHDMVRHPALLGGLIALTTSAHAEVTRFNVLERTA